MLGCNTATNVSKEKASHAHLQFWALLLLVDGAIRYNISAAVKQPTNTRGGQFREYRWVLELESGKEGVEWIHTPRGRKSGAKQIAVNCMRCGI